MPKADRNYSMDEIRALELIISASVGFPVEVYSGDGEFMGMGRGRFHQIMPRIDPLGGAFWAWHLDKNPNDHWFPTPLESGAAFVLAFQRYQRMFALSPTA